MPESYLSERHQALKSELKIRMLLAKEKIKDRKGEHYEKRVEELKCLYEDYKRLIIS